MFILERPVHYSEKVLDVVQNWGAWAEEFGKDSYLCFKDNYIYQNIQLVVSSEKWTILWITGG